MSFMKIVLKENVPIWDQCAASPFVSDMLRGTLPFQCFKEYIIQDSIYLKHYARVYGKAIYHASALKDIQLYYSMLGFVSDTESTVRLHYLEQFGLTDDDIELIEPLPENQNYIDFLLDTAERGNEVDILMAVLPCMLSYSYIFRKLAADPISRTSRYADFISDYADDQYADSCRDWCAFAHKKCKGLSEADLERAGRIFMTASYLELDFWNMAYKEEKK